MSSVMERSFAILERLATDVDGVQLATLADELAIPPSGVHRLLLELLRHGYVRQSGERGSYMLTSKLVSLGLSYLKNSGIVDLCRPIMDRLAESSSELVRLSVVDVDHLTWVSLSQGARGGLRYDPVQGTDAKLACTASGHAWLSTLDEDDALMLVAKQGFGKPSHDGPGAPVAPTALLKTLRVARKQGYAIAIETFTQGISAIAAPIVRSGKGTVGVLTISGPSLRLTEEKMKSLAPDLVAAAAEIAAVSPVSPLFDRPWSPQSEADIRRSSENQAPERSLSQ